eukprot:2406161-Alexandrium_andersonii.AAC.1
MRWAKVPFHRAPGVHGPHNPALTQSLQLGESAMPARCNLACGHWRLAKADLNAPFSDGPQASPTVAAKSRKIGSTKAPCPPPPCSKCKWRCSTRLHRQRQTDCCTHR